MGMQEVGTLRRAIAAAARSHPAHRSHPEGVLLAGAWNAETGRGNGYRGVTVAVVEGEVGMPTSGTRLSIGAVHVDRLAECVALTVQVEPRRSM